MLSNITDDVLISSYNLLSYISYRIVQDVKLTFYLLRGSSGCGHKIFLSFMASN